MKKLFTVICLAILVLALTGLALSYEREAGIAFYLSPAGDDSGDGSADAPFRTIERAQEAVRQRLPTEKKQITVNLMAGDYFIDGQISFGPEDSGTPEATVIWRGAGDGRTLLHSAIRLDPAEAKPVTDPGILGRITDPAARDALLCVDLSPYLDEIPPILPTSMQGDLEDGPFELYINGQPLRTARWPNAVHNEAYLPIQSAAQQGADTTDPIKITYLDPENRAAGWSAASLSELYVDGFINNQYHNELYRVAQIDPERRTLTTAAGSLWDPPIAENGRLYFLNLPEEIDTPGECWIDRASRIIYFYPPGDMAQAEIFLTRRPESDTYHSSLLDFSGTRHIVLEGLDIGYSRSSAITAYQVSDFTVRDCTVAHTNAFGIKIDDSDHCTIQDSDIYDTLYAQVYIYCNGQRRELVNGTNTVERCSIHSPKERPRFGAMMVISTVGAVIRDNVIYDSPMYAIELHGSNDALVEGNEIFDCVRDGSDMGAVSYGGDPTMLGVRIYGNYFHDIGHDYPGIGPTAIFIDDGTTGPHIAGNVFERACTRIPAWSAPIRTNGAQFTLVENNVFIDSAFGAIFGSWTYDMGERPFREDEWLADKLDVRENSPPRYGELYTATDFFGDRWRAHYKGTWWARVWDFLSPQGYAEAQALSQNPDGLGDYLAEHAPSCSNVFQGNLAVGITDELYHENGRGTGNLILEKARLPDGSPLFRDEAAGNYALTDAGLAYMRTVWPDFENIKAGLK